MVLGEVWMVDDGYQEEKVSEGEAKIKCWMLNKKRVAETERGGKGLW